MAIRLPGAVSVGPFLNTEGSLFPRSPQEALYSRAVWVVLCWQVENHRTQRQPEPWLRNDWLANKGSGILKFSQKVTETGICSPKYNTTEKYWEKMLTLLQAGCRLSFGSNHFLRISALQTALEDRDRVSLQSEGQACLPHVIKDLGTLSSGFLSYSGTHCVQRWHLAIFIPILCGARGANTQDTDMLTIWLLLFLSVIKSFFSDPEISCLLPTWNNNRRTYYVTNRVKPQTLCSSWH